MTTLFQQIGNLLYSLYQPFPPMVQMLRQRIDDEVIKLLRTVLNATWYYPPGHPNHPVGYLLLATYLLARYERSGEIEDLEESIRAGLDGLESLPEDHSQRALALNNLGMAFHSRYRRSGQMEDLEKSIEYNRDALDLRPDGHTANRGADRAGSLNNLAVSLLSRYNYSQREEDFEESVSLRSDGLEICPTSHRCYLFLLDGLADSFSLRFDQSRQMVDLEEAIKLGYTGLTLCHESDPYRASFLDGLADSLCSRYKQTHQLVDLDQSIIFHRDALAHRPEGHLERPTSLNHLANNLLMRYTETEQTEDLEEAITFQRAALVLCPEGHSEHSLVMNNLADALMLKKLGRSGKLEFPDDLQFSDPLQPFSLTDSLQPPTQSHSLQSRQIVTEELDLEELEESFRLYESAALHPFSSLLVRFRVATSWATMARFGGHSDSLRAYKIALSLLERTLTIYPTLRMQHDLLVGKNSYTMLASDAASYAIACGEFTQAVEMLEQGRGLIWSQLNGLRTPLEKLAGINKGLADQFLKSSQELETLVTSESKLGRRGLGVNDKPSRLEKNIELIRKTPGFEDFLQAPRFSTLQKAAFEGPVIVVTHNQYRSDVLIVLHDRPPVCIELDSKFYHDSILRTQALKDVLKQVRFAPAKVDRALSDAMKFLWERVVSLVVAKLDELGIKKQSRIWWCPTSVLSALPFHAAGPIRVEDRKRKYLLDDYVSSYTPTLTALIKSRSGTISHARNPPFLVVSQLDDTLPQAEKEVRVIKKGRDWVEGLLGEDATREAVIDKLRDHHWIHLVCHGNLNPGEPFSHWFSLSNRSRLTLLDIIQSRIPMAELAFLSACHSAEQSLDSAREEVLHLAAAMQFCGFRSVVGTMWVMDDEDGPFVAKEFYKYMFQEEDSSEEGFRRSARALCEATRRLRRRKDITIERWVNFIHIGA